MNTYCKIFFPLGILICSCSGNVPLRNEVIVHELSDPESLNPINFADATAGYVGSHIFQKLVDVDFKNPEGLVGVLAEAPPQVEKTPDGKMYLTFRIRKEAKWDNGAPITAKDAEFSLKTILCPLVNNPGVKPYFEFIDDFKFYDDDPLKFTVISNQVYFLADASFGDAPIIPEYVYDPKGRLRKFTIKQISEEGEKLAGDPDIKAFAGDFNSEKHIRDLRFVNGSGPYKATDWKTNERLTLTKKENWWGAALVNENCLFEAYPDKLIYQIIKDQTTALVSLKAGNIDVMRGIKSKDFVELPKSEKFIKNFNAFTPVMYAYTYIGINMKNPLLSDKQTRHALAHLTNAEQMRKTIRYGLAEAIVGPVHPSKKKYYNANITGYNYDPGKAKNLLEQAGWKNTNGDETLDKMINGKHTEFVLDFLVNSESDEKKSAALMFQADAKKVGIKVNILTNDFVVFLGKCKKHEFDLTLNSWITGPAPDDFKQVLHSESALNEGSNYESFSNPEADGLIDSIRVELNEDRRIAMYMRLQEIVHEECPRIFLWAPAERIAISKRFDNAYPSVIRPGYWENGFRVKAVND